MADKNTAKIDVHLTAEQKLVLQRLAELEGKDLSPYVREVVISHIREKHGLMVSMLDVFEGCESAVSSGEQL